MTNCCCYSQTSLWAGFVLWVKLSSTRITVILLPNIVGNFLLETGTLQLQMLLSCCNMNSNNFLNALKILLYAFSHQLFIDWLTVENRKVEFNVKTWRKINVILNTYCECIFDCIRLCTFSWIPEGYIKYLSERAEIPDWSLLKLLSLIFITHIHIYHSEE